jgi:hypothetical protein
MVGDLIFIGILLFYSNGHLFANKEKRKDSHQKAQNNISSLCLSERIIESLTKWRHFVIDGLLLKTNQGHFVNLTLALKTNLCGFMIDALTLLTNPCRFVNNSLALRTTPCRFVNDALALKTNLCGFVNDATALKTNLYGFINDAMMCSLKHKEDILFCVFCAFLWLSFLFSFVTLWARQDYKSCKSRFRHYRFPVASTRSSCDMAASRFI